MSWALDRALEKGQVNHAIFVEIGHPEGDACFWSGFGPFTHAGKTYTGAGDLGSVDTVAESLEVEIHDVAFKVSGIDADLVAGLSKSIKGRDGLVYEAILDADWNVVDWELIMSSRLDVLNYQLGADGRASITIRGHAGLFFLANRTAAKYSPEDWIVRFPDETGFDEVHRVEDQTLNWAAS